MPSLAKTPKASQATPSTAQALNPQTPLKKLLGAQQPHSPSTQRALKHPQSYKSPKCPTHRADKRIKPNTQPRPQSPHVPHTQSPLNTPHTAQNSGLNQASSHSPLSAVQHSTNNHGPLNAPSPLNTTAHTAQGTRPNQGFNHASTTSTAPHTHRLNPLEQASTHSNPTSKSFA
ncbi:hypothetical protein NHP21005_17240 [Helicobacter sp. NHP21005]|uniref:hypothetical protein n=1 Tax=Helicobacter felistomachi TaxID=3040201 RepID=UPI002573C3AE|nr:hypothetical protein [Helicobacter sp. NHP21005]BEG58036.1 hypothetical protein NHP21005_17240 [Helicobacter sp. NHP21005]